MSSKINKIKNYNQIILAIAGTVALIILLIAGFYLIDELTRNFFRNNDNSNQGILALDETEALMEDTLRRQVVSFNNIRIIDSVTQTYLLPVTQANLAEAEYANELLGLMNSKTRSGRYDRYYGNIYNNLVLYNGLTDTPTILFNERISIKNFVIHTNQNDNFVVIPACSVDSNEDGYLNSGDLQELFVYDINRAELTKIEAEENYTTLEVFQPAKSQDLVVHFGIDRNKNGSFESVTEPMSFYKVDLQKMTLVKFLDDQQLLTLQQLLEGS